MSRNGQGERVLVLGEDLRIMLPILRSLGRKGLRVEVGWAPPDAAFLRSRHVARVHEMPRFEPTDEGWKKALMDLLRDEKFALVIPATEAATYAVHQCRDQVPRGVPVAIVSEETFTLAFDKQATQRLAASLEIPVPRCRLVSDERELARVAEELSMPLVVKASCSVDADNWRTKHMARIVHNAAERLEAARGPLHAGQPVLVQEFFPGRGHGVEFLAVDGQLLFTFQHRRLHETIGHGSTYRESVPRNAELVEATRRWAAAANYSGVGMAEFRVNESDGRFVLLEINARFWGSLPLAVAAGADFPYYLYEALVLGRRQFFDDYRLGVRSRHLIDDLRWQWRALRGGFEQAAVADDRTDGWTMNRLPLRQVLADAARVVLPSERIDSFSWDDPVPIFAETAALARLAFSKLRG